ncbi:MAG: hypothetical protein AB1898_21425 [Acidobacteriota bacterium]
MRSCRQWQEPLIDHASGQPVPADLKAHLASCSHCSERLRALKARATQIEIELAGMANPEPSPFLAGRILANLPHRPPQVRLGWAKWITVAGTVCCIAAIIILLVYRSAAVKQQDRQALQAAERLGQWESPTRLLMQPSSVQALLGRPVLGDSFFQLPGPTRHLNRRNHEP